MITIVPTTLKPFNIPAMAGAVDLIQPFTQLSRVPASTREFFWADPSALAQPNWLRTLEQAHTEGILIEVVVGGGRTIAERQAAASWAFLPTVILTKIPLDDLIELTKEEQRKTNSHTANVAPTREGMARFKGRPGAKPSIEVMEPDANEDASDATTDEISNS